MTTTTVEEATSQETSREVAFHDFARTIETCYGVGSWRVAPSDVCSDASNVVFEVTVPAEQIDDAPFTLAKIARDVKEHTGHRFTAIALTAEEAQPA